MDKDFTIQRFNKSVKTKIVTISNILLDCVEKSNLTIDVLDSIIGTLQRDIRSMIKETEDIKTV